ncbi:MAG: hypothetical protein IPM46_05850 [Flavobacteriales bacterium]|nr:hypothetical protein [Flavobacteriales bacterium]
MTKEVADASIERILDEWDPIGVNYFKGRPMKEYVSYVPRVVRAYVAGNSLFTTLDAINVELMDNSSEEMTAATQRAADDLEVFLNSIGQIGLRRLYSL